MSTIWKTGEALGAIGEPSVIPILEKYREDPVQEVAETCELALDRLKWLEDNKYSSVNSAEDLQKNSYSTIDPAPPAKITNVDVLRKILLDESRSLFDRYSAMFSLRDLGTKESTLALVEGNSTSILVRKKIIIWRVVINRLSFMQVWKPVALCSSTR